MDKNSVSRRLIHYQSNIEKISGTLLKAKKHLLGSDIAAYQDTVQAASWEAEKLARSLRDLTFQTAVRNKKEMMLKAAEALQIVTVQEKLWIKVTLPALLAHRKAGQSNGFLVDPLRYAITSFAQEQGVRPLERGVVCVRFLYRKDFPERWYRDHDNIECKQVLDALLDKLLVDDVGTRCLNLYQTVKASRDATEIFVMPMDALPDCVKIYVEASAETLEN